MFGMQDHVRLLCRHTLEGRAEGEEPGHRHRRFAVAPVPAAKALL